MLTGAKLVSVLLVTFSVLGVLQALSQLPAGSAVAPQQKVVTVTVYVPVYQTVYVQQPVPYPVTYTVTAYRTTSFTRNQSITFNSTVNNPSVSTYVVLVSATQFNSSHCSYTSTFTNTNVTDTIQYGYYSSGGTAFTSYITLHPVHTFTGRTTCAVTQAPVTVSVPALFGFPLPEQYFGVTLLTLGGVMGLALGYSLSNFRKRKQFK